ncbi:MAG: DUF4339 domain-containing protein [Prevotella sp.]|nr:DUF4339 domain-containing protein [Prevotella sp.]
MKYFIITNGVQLGPFTIEELQQHAITSETLVWAEGMAQWTPAWQMDELKPLLYGQGSPTHTTTTPPPPPILDSENAEAPHTPKSSGDVSHLQDNIQPSVTDKKNGSPWIWVAIVLVGLLLFMGVTNPSKDDHRMVIKENITKGLSQALTDHDSDFLSQSMGMLSQMLAGTVVNAVLDNMLQYHNFLFFSTTTIETKNGNVTTSYGVMGKVFTAGEEKIASIISTATDSSISKQVFGSEGPTGRQDANDNKDNTSSDQALKEDTTTLSRQIGNVIIDHVGQQVKKQINENTDSTTSHSIGTIVDDVIKFIKGL